LLIANSISALQSQVRKIFKEYLHDKKLNIYLSLIMNNVEEKKSAHVQTPLEKHVGFFADASGQVTFTSIRDAQRSVGDGLLVASGKAAAVMAVGSKIVKGCRFAAFTPMEGVKLIHPCDSRVFTADGGINEVAWEQLVKATVGGSGGNFIRQDSLMKYMEICREIDASNTDVKFWTKLSKGEWDDLFAKCTNHWDKTPEDRNYQPCITVALLREFFEDTPAVFTRCKDKLLPVREPTVP
jgi:hypothetical protein